VLRVRLLGVTPPARDRYPGDSHDICVQARRATRGPPRYHEADDGVSVEPEVLDPVMPGLQQVADEKAPAVVAPWAQYVRTRRYAAVVQRLKGLTRAGKTAVPGRRPIGFLPGDDVTPQDVAMAMMARECQ
jgi:hypothetical protein